MARPYRTSSSKQVRMRPMNLIARFLLEVAALVALGYWGYRMLDGDLRFVLAAAVPLLAAVVWGIFAVPGDPSRSGKAPVPVSGSIRLAIELVFFASGAYALYASDMQSLALVFALAVAVHYLISMDRIRWLLSYKKQ